MNWHSLRNLRQSSDNEIFADVRVGPDSGWFSGHFPGKPILPGIAQLAMVSDAIRQAEGKDLSISSIKKIRFRQPVKPDDELKIVVTPVRGEIYSFCIRLKGETACSGTISMKPVLEIGN